MCLLMVSMGTIPNYNHIVNASNNNPDGFGYAILANGKILSGRGMNAQTTIDRFFDELEKAAKSDPDFIAMYHSRLTTHGSTNTENCHPFRVDGRKDIILGHNGMLPIHPKAGDKRSDTRIFAEDVLPTMGIEALDDPSSFAKLEDWASGSKIAILTVAPELRDNLYILNESAGTWEDNIWWSNGSYKQSYRFYGSGYYSTGNVLKDDIKVLTSRELINGVDDADVLTDSNCFLCTTALTVEDLDDNMCGNCASCLDCYEHANQCLCYNPVKYASSLKYNTPLNYDY